MIGLEMSVVCSFCNSSVRVLNVGDPEGSESSTTVKCLGCGSEFMVTAVMTAVAVRFGFDKLERYVVRVLGLPKHVSDGMCVCGPLTGGQCASVPAIARMCGVGEDTVQSWKRRGMDDRRADRVATALGAHPSDVWPDEWDALCAADWEFEDDEMENA